MNEWFDDVRVCEVLKTAKNCRMEHLELDFAAWEEYKETVAVKEALLEQMEEFLPDRVKKMLCEYDDAWALMVGRTQDFFYVQGIIDCLSLVRQVLREKG